MQPSGRNLIVPANDKLSIQRQKSPQIAYCKD